MNIWLKSAGLGLVAAVAAFFLLRLQKKKVLPPLYNVSFKLQTEGSPDAGTTRSVATNLEKRMEGMDYSIKIPSPGIITIDLRRVPDTRYLRQLVSSNGLVEFRETYQAVELGENFIQGLYNAAQIKNPEPAGPQPLSPADSLARELERTESASEEPGRKNSNGNSLISPEISGIESPEIGSTYPKDTAALLRLLKSDSLQKLHYPGPLPEFCFGMPAYLNTRTPGKLMVYALRPKNTFEKNYLDNEDIKSARAELNTLGHAVVTVELTRVGQSQWTRLTGHNAGKPIAIMLDNIAISVPRVESEMYTPSVQILGDFTFFQCQIMARMINSRPLTTPVRVVSATTEQTSHPFNPRQLIGPALIFLLAAGLAFFVFKTLKST